MRDRHLLQALPFRPEGRRNRRRTDREAEAVRHLREDARRAHTGSVRGGSQGEVQEGAGADAAPYRR